jgi:nucleoside-diphosphate-sugar epimerase
MTAFPPGLYESLLTNSLAARLEALPEDRSARTDDLRTAEAADRIAWHIAAVVERAIVHWESQSVTRADSKTGRRYREHAGRGSHVLLFARLNTDERAFHFLGPARYVRHEGEQPMAITWKLEYRLPGDLYQAFAAAVA